MSDLWITSYVLLWIIVVAMAFLMVGILRQLGLIQARLGPDPGALITPEGLNRGTEAPDFGGLELSAKKHIRINEFQGERVLLVFLSTTCVPCRELIPHLNEVSRGYRGRLETLTICQGSEEACVEFAKQTKLQTKFVADPANFVGALYGVKFTPFAYLIDERGIVLIRGVVNISSHLEAFLREEGNSQGDKSWQIATEPAEAALKTKRTQQNAGALLQR